MNVNAFFIGSIVLIVLKMELSTVIILFLVGFGNLHVSFAPEHALENLDMISGFLLYLDEGGPKVQCFITIVRRDGWFLGAGTCLYDEWGNFLGAPQSYLIKTQFVTAAVVQIYLHPNFWASNTQNNVAMFKSNLTENDYEDIFRLIPVIPEHEVEPNDTFIFTKNVDTQAFPSIFEADIVDRDRFCYRQMFPLAMRLRYDNLCVTVPEFGVHLHQERYYAGAPLISHGYRYLYELYAILSFNYRCRNMVRTAIFTRLSFHKEFIEDPEKYILDVVADFNRRHFGQNNTGTPRPGATLIRKSYLCVNLYFLIAFAFF
ncbi:uncharacterized protein LOC119661528 [Hermetia illucens]|uniref:uncharacterized protein LOC119661528 n=1 Tax=Hermetia illucens TaxID=343691 RepID=UPI0018CC14E9|nr:uncharacterized protein LOC119661528 [Hermetia illucens]